MNIINTRPQVNIAQINSFRPNTNFSNVPEMCLGRCNANYMHRLLVQFPITSIPEDAIIISATFKFFVSAAAGECLNYITPYMITESWTYNTVTWRNQPIYDSYIYGNTLGVKKCGQYLMDITNIVQDWHAGNYTNNGIILRSAEQNDKIISKINTDSISSYPPVIEIKYILKCVCEVEATQFEEVVRSLTLDAGATVTFMQDTSVMKTITVFIQNQGPASVNAKLQISPNGTIVVDDGENISIDQGNTIVMVPYRFARYTHVVIKNNSTTQTAQLNYFFQIQK